MIRWLNMSVWGLALSIALGVMAGAGGFTFCYPDGTSYLSNNPTASINRHVLHDLVGKYMNKAEHGCKHAKASTLENFS